MKMPVKSALDIEVKTETRRPIRLAERVWGKRTDCKYLETVHIKHTPKILTRIKPPMHDIN